MNIENSRDWVDRVDCAIPLFTTLYFSLEPGNSLGIGLGERSPSSQQLQGIFVQCVIEGTPAANDGRLR